MKHIRNSSDYKNEGVKDQRNELNLREEEIRIDKNPGSSSSYKPMPRRVPAAGLVNSINLSGQVGPVSQSSGVAYLNPSLSNYGRNLSNRFEYR